jgi:hypothetical protein
MMPTRQSPTWPTEVMGRTMPKGRRHWLPHCKTPGHAQSPPVVDRGTTRRHRGKSQVPKRRPTTKPTGRPTRMPTTAEGPRHPNTPTTGTWVSWAQTLSSRRPRRPQITSTTRQTRILRPVTGRTTVRSPVLISLGPPIGGRAPDSTAPCCLGDGRDQDGSSLREMP